MLRRRFLRQSAFVLLAPTALTSACKDTALPGVGRKVLVVGAGIAGLRAATRLLEEGFEVTVLEASNRWGGRIQSLQGFADFGIELGAEEVHGEKSDWCKFVQKNGATFVDADTEDLYWLDNALRTEAQLDNDADVQAGFTFIENAETYSGADLTVTQHADNQGLSSKVRSFVNAQIGNESGTSNSRLSIKGFAEENDRWSAGDLNRGLANRTYQQIMEQTMAAAIDRVQLNTVVKTVDYTSNLVRVTDASGQSYEADHVLITVPLTVLRDGDIAFSPALPSAKTAAVQKIGMGAGMKIILKFNNRFWPANLGSLYGSGPVPEYWFTSLGRGNTPVLTAFVMGEKADFLSAQGAAAVQTVLADLDEIFGNSLATNAFTEARVADWSKAPHIRGAYSYTVVGGGISQREALAQPVSGRLFFAGEATHTGGHNSTVHGAWETADRAVDEIIG